MNWPKIAIVVTTYSIESKRYLDLCLQSIKNLNYPKDKIRTTVCCHKSQLEPYSRSINYNNLQLVAPPEDQFYNPRGLNFGMTKASEMNPEIDYFLILNDDVILTRDSLMNMVRTIHSASVPAITNGISPCDNYGMYTFYMGFEHMGEEVHMPNKFYRLEGLEDKTQSMMMAKSKYPQGAIHVPFLCMYATLIPKSAWQKIGEFDENFKTGQDDLDYSRRAHQCGVRTIVCTDALVWHFGGVTADKSISLETRKANLRYFKEKWGEYPPDVTQEMVDNLDERYKFENRKLKA